MKIHTFAVGLLTTAIAAQIVPGKVFALDLPTTAAANSVDTYEQAFAAAARTGLTKSPLLQQDPRTTPLDDKTKTFLDANHDVVRLVKQAAAEPACDWGNLPTDMQRVLDTLNHARTLDSLLLLQARQDIKDAKPAAAVDDWLAAIAMSRRIGQIKLIVSSLVNDATESRTIDEIAKVLPALPPVARNKLDAGWRNLPPAVTGSQMIMGEYAYAKRAGVNQKVAGWIDALQPFYTNLAAAAGDRPDKFDKTVDDQMAKFKLNPFAQTIGPSLKRIRQPMATTEAKRALLPTAIAVLTTGPDAVKQSHDPFANAPFKYTPTDNGFELESTLTSKDKPVTLHIGPS
jgi:hypothetical protein